MKDIDIAENAYKNGYEKGRAEALRYSSPGIPLSKEEQIKEMAQLMCHNEDGRLCDSFPCSLCPTKSLAEVLYNVGYRREIDVAAAIIAEIEPIFMSGCLSLDAYTAWKKLHSEIYGRKRGNKMIECTTLQVIALCFSCFSLGFSIGMLIFGR